MRWLEPSTGDEKIKRKFALYPIRINKEVRWLEFVTIKYVFYDWVTIKYDNGYGYYYGWRKEKFID